MTFTKNYKTQIRFLSYSKDMKANLVDDAEFPGSLDETYKNIIAIIEESKYTTAHGLEGTHKTPPQKVPHPSTHVTLK